jgi:hypothetical protein
VKPHAFALLLAAAASVLFARAALAQPSTATTLARKCVGESSWRTDDCAAILHVLKRRGARVGVNAATMAARYGDSAYPSRPWVAQLEPKCEQPPQWPASLAWRAHRVKCLAVFATVAAFERGELRDPCAGATQWGSRTLASDVRRAQRALDSGRWALAKCSTANAFYRELRK